MTPSFLIETNPNLLFMFTVINGRNRHQKDICLVEKGPIDAQNMLTILDSIVNVIGEACMAI